MACKRVALLTVVVCTFVGNAYAMNGKQVAGALRGSTLEMAEYELVQMSAALNEIQTIEQQRAVRVSAWKQYEIANTARREQYILKLTDYLQKNKPTKEEHEIMRQALQRYAAEQAKADQEMKVIIDRQ